MNSIVDIQEELVSAFELLEDPTDKYNYIIELGSRLPPFPSAFYTDAHLIKGCQSKVWLSASQEDGSMVYLADSESLLVKGLAAIMIKVLSRQKPQDILKADLSFIERIGLNNMLSMNRANGFASLIQNMQRAAQSAL
ncbi:MAG: SufE family protein [Cytophagales bacterium]|nr:MAG: SufE family protein [Cytophagales bacterium]TAF60781.1 MAG: SufE family protein [Cytophagales bacterium]